MAPAMNEPPIPPATRAPRRATPSTPLACRLELTAAEAIAGPLGGRRGHDRRRGRRQYEPPAPETDEQEVGQYERVRRPFPGQHEEGRAQARDDEPRDE